MDSCIAAMIARYGNEMELTRDDTTQSITAFLHNTCSTGAAHARKSVGPLGEIPAGSFVYLGPVSPRIMPGDLLRYQQRLFEVRRSEQICVGNVAVYTWGLCVERSEGSV